MTEDVPGYRELEQVGEGGFGVVYRAHQEYLDRMVALKVLSIGSVDDAAMRRFQRESKITGRQIAHSGGAVLPAPRTDGAPCRLVHAVLVHPVLGVHAVRSPAGDAAVVPLHLGVAARPRAGTAPRRPPIRDRAAPTPRRALARTSSP